MLYKEAIEFLYSLRLFGAKLGLENTFRLAERAGNPQQRLRFIHVAGTNGKGSTCAMLESIYRAAGLKTGLFTSPHLVSFCERIQVNRIPISERDVARLVAEVQPLLEEFSADAHPTFFEVVTVMALRYFEQQQCDLVIWETGLGGRLDATNIVTPLASVITNVQYDHQQWLGDSLDKIAFEKAGIIKPGVPVICAADAPQALETIQRIAQSCEARLILVTGQSVRALENIRLPLLGEHQRLNAALAVETAQTLRAVIPISDAVIRAGLEAVSWPGRLQLVTAPSGQKFVLDGAHNLDGARALRKAMENLFPERPGALVLGILRDKDCEQICEILAPLAQVIYVCRVDTERSAAPELLAEFCHIGNPAARVVICNSLEEALDHSSDQRFVLITGSLYFVGQAIELLKAAPAAAVAERRLNEWNAVPAKARGGA
jgi:dihydrofolate synthase/folylpolyglutamate synthase